MRRPAIALLALLALLCGLGHGLPRARPRRGVRAPPSRVFCTGVPGGDGNDDDELREDMSLSKKKGNSWKKFKNKDTRDMLPFDVINMTPPETKIGVFRLQPHTNCGDLLTWKDESFLVKRVTCSYRYMGGALRMFKKTAQVVELNRAFQERSLERSFKTDFDTDEPTAAG